jgi:hypothetical protein
VKKNLNVRFTADVVCDIVVVCDVIAGSDVVIVSDVVATIFDVVVAIFSVIVIIFGSVNFGDDGGAFLKHFVCHFGYGSVGSSVLPSKAASESCRPRRSQRKECRICERSPLDFV